MIFEGLKITLTSMVLEDAGLIFGISSIKRGLIETTPAILFCMAGVVLIDTALYFFARFLVLPKRLEKLTEKVKLKIQSSKYKNNFIFISIILSRFTPGLRFPTALTAGHIRISFLSFILVDAVALATWFSIYISIGLQAVNLFSPRV